MRDAAQAFMVFAAGVLGIGMAILLLLLAGTWLGQNGYIK